MSSLFVTYRNTPYLNAHLNQLKEAFEKTYPLELLKLIQAYTQCFFIEMSLSEKRLPSYENTSLISVGPQHNEPKILCKQRGHIEVSTIGKKIVTTRIQDPQVEVYRKIFQINSTTFYVLRNGNFGRNLGLHHLNTSKNCLTPEWEDLAEDFTYQPMADTLILWNENTILVKYNSGEKTFQRGSNVQPWSLLWLHVNGETDLLLHHGRGDFFNPIISFAITVPKNEKGPERIRSMIRSSLCMAATSNVEETELFLLLSKDRTLFICVISLCDFTLKKSKKLGSMPEGIDDTYFMNAHHDLLGICTTDETITCTLLDVHSLNKLLVFNLQNSKLNFNSHLQLRLGEVFFICEDTFLGRDAPKQHVVYPSEQSLKTKK